MQHWIIQRSQTGIDKSVSNSADVVTISHDIDRIAGQNDSSLVKSALSLSKQQVLFISNYTSQTRLSVIKPAPYCDSSTRTCVLHWIICGRHNNIYCPHIYNNNNDNNNNNMTSLVPISSENPCCVVCKSQTYNSTVTLSRIHHGKGILQCLDIVFNIHKEITI